MTHERGYDLASRVLSVCGVHHKKLFCQFAYGHSCPLSRDENGCNVLKKVITVADDLFKDQFLDKFAEQAPALCTEDLGISLIEHVLNLDFTQRTTRELKDTRLHDLMSEFDEIITSKSHDDDHELLNKLASTLTLDLNLFAEFVETRRGSLMVQVVLGRSEETDRIILAAIKERFTDIPTKFYGYRILVRTINVFKKRGKPEVYDQILRLIGIHALYLIKETEMGNWVVQAALNIENKECNLFISCGLQCHYLELSFLERGSKILGKLLEQRTTIVPLVSILIEIVKCDEDTLVRLAKDEYGNVVLEKTMELAKIYRPDLFCDFVEKFRPFLDRLRGSLGENIASIIDSHAEMVKDRIVSEEIN
ncbi:unnamed protein product [Cochlearia groenlandica]